MDDLTLEEAAAIIGRDLALAVEAAPKMAAGFRSAATALNDPDIRCAIDEGRTLDAQRMLLALTE
jgi:molybdopterin-biosynthesis enzyme MoeA-like protein